MVKSQDTFDESHEYHYLQLIYDAKLDRNSSYGHELRFIPVIGTREQGFARAEREPSFYIVYRAKAEHYTGKENLPAIELLLQLPDTASLESILEFGNLRLGQRRQVRKADLLVRALSSPFRQRKGRLEQLNHDLEKFVSQYTSLTHEISDVVPNDSFMNSFFSNEPKLEYELNATIQGPIQHVLSVYYFLQEYGVNYKKLAIAFS